MIIRWSRFTEEELDKLIDNAKFISRCLNGNIYDIKKKLPKNIFTKFINTIFHNMELSMDDESKIARIQEAIDYICYFHDQLHILQDAAFIKKTIQDYHNFQTKIEFEEKLPLGIGNNVGDIPAETTGTKLTFYQSNDEEISGDLHLFYKFKKCEMYLPDIISIKTILSAEKTGLSLTDYVLDMSEIDTLVDNSYKEIEKISETISEDIESCTDMIKSILERTPEETRSYQSYLAAERNRKREDRSFI